MPFSAYAASLNQTNAFAAYNLSSSAQRSSAASQTNSELGVIAPCPQGFSLMGWLDGVVICSLAEVGFDHQSLINELESIQSNSDLSYDEKIMDLIGVMEAAGLGETVFVRSHFDHDNFYENETMLLSGTCGAKIIAYTILIVVTIIECTMS